MLGFDAVNAVGGGIVGMLFAIFLQQPLQDAWFHLRKRTRIAMRSLRHEEHLGHTWQTFSLGPLHTDALIVEGDGENVISRDRVHVHVLPDEVALPAEMAGWRDEIEEQSTELRAHLRVRAGRCGQHALHVRAVGVA